MIFKDNLSQHVNVVSNSRNIFFNINNDLVCSIKNLNYPINVLLSYSFCRKFALSGLYIQKLISNEDFEKSISMLDNIKKRINVYRDKDYKDIIKQYEKDSIEYLRLYDSKLTIKIIKSVMVIAETNLVTKNTTVKQISDYKKIINYAKLVMPNDYMSAKSSNKIEINNKKKYLFVIIILIAIVVICYIFFYDDIMFKNHDYIKSLDEIDA